MITFKRVHMCQGSVDDIFGVEKKITIKIILPKVRPEIVDIVINEVTFAAIIRKTIKGSLIFYGPHDYHVSVFRQPIPLSGQTLISTKVFHPIIQQSINDQFFPVICK